MIRWTFIAILMAASIVRSIERPSVLNWIVSLVWTAFVVVGARTFLRERHGTLRIGASHLDVDEQLVVPMDCISDCAETPVGISIQHGGQGEPSSFELRRHDFTLSDWQAVTSLVFERVRTCSPQARIRTIQDPPDGA